MGFFLFGICFVCVGAVWVRWAAVWCTDIRRMAGRVGRSLDVFVDALGARQELFCVRGAVGGHVGFEEVPGVG